MLILTLTEPSSKDELIMAFRTVQTQTNIFWRGFNSTTFIAPLHGSDGVAWSPYENVQHLIKSITPIERALGAPAAVLHKRFGIPNRPSRSYADICNLYASTLATMGNLANNPFGPDAMPADMTPDALQAATLAQWQAAEQALIVAIEKYPADMLDQCQLPHPIMGLFTMREMLFFTLYHGIHHVNDVAKLI